jgi:hypothetical protein
MTTHQAPILSACFGPKLGFHANLKCDQTNPFLWATKMPSNSFSPNPILGFLPFPPSLLKPKNEPISSALVAHSSLWVPFIHAAQLSIRSRHMSGVQTYVWLKTLHPHADNTTTSLHGSNLDNLNHYLYHWRLG